MKIEHVAGGHRNATFRVSGLIDSFDAFYINTGYDKLKMTAATWAIQEKAGIRFGWTKEEPVFVMESRNMMKFDTGITCPEDWDGRIWLKPFKLIDPPYYAMVILDFDK